MQLKDIQDKIAAALAEVEWIAGKGIEPIAEDSGDVVNVLATRIAKCGSAILVGSCRFEPESKASKVTVGKASVVIQCLERVIENRAQADYATSLDIAEVVHWSLNMLAIEGVGCLVSRSIVPTVVDAHTISHDVTVEVQTTLGNPLDN